MGHQRLEAAESAGLLERPSPWPCWRGAARGALVALVLGLVGLLRAMLSGASEQLEKILQSLFSSQPPVVLALAGFLLMALSRLIDWAVE